MSDARDRPHVVIVGGGFAGLYAARALRRAPVRITLIDRCNHHVFQPLLYEVATAALSPADIAEPIRRIFSADANIQVLLGQVERIDPERRRVTLHDGHVEYDYLILATGVTHDYFGHDEWAAHAPGLKTVEDALEIRRRFLLAFEAAEREADETARRAKLNFVIVGAGPTGVELAGTMSELARRSIQHDFRSIDPSTARVILIEGQARVLPGFPPILSERARADLLELGVEVKLNCRVTAIDEHGVMIGDERIEAENVFWAAGVAASPLGRSLGVPVDGVGRVRVEPDCSLPGHPEAFVVGDLAAIDDLRTGEPVPGIAPAAIQMGRYAARIIDREVRRSRRGEVPETSRAPFRFRDKGMLATIGRARAVGEVGVLRLRGLVAWLAWALIHIYFLIGFRNRTVVMIRWAWAYLVFSRGARLITGPVDLELRAPVPPESVRGGGGASVNATDALEISGSRGA